MSTFLLIPGGWHGGWYFEPIAGALRRKGHRAFAMTLTGLGDGRDRATAPSHATQAAAAATANLDTHIQDVLTLLDAEDIHDAVLVGHSYAGMVITGAAARADRRVRRLVYSDAYVPADGDSCFDLTTPAFRDLFLQGAVGDGRTVPPPPGLDPRTSPHPLASFLQRIRLDGEPRVDRRDYIYLDGWAGTPFAEVHRRLRDDPAWHVHSLPIGHNVARDAPEDLLRILLEE
jgi:pimeloyl-ACP methyl ester carboxylesterase